MKFKKGEQITSSDIRLSLGATSDSPIYHVNKNLELLLTYAKDMSDREVEKYLLYIKKILDGE